MELRSTRVMKSAGARALFRATGVKNSEFDKPVIAATSGLSIGHISPEAAAGGAIRLVEEGDRIRIDIPGRRLEVLVSDAVLAERRAKMEASPSRGSRRRRGRALYRPPCAAMQRSQLARTGAG